MAYHLQYKKSIKTNLWIQIDQYVDLQIDRQINRQKDGQIERQIDRCMYRQKRSDDKWEKDDWQEEVILHVCIHFAIIAITPFCIKGNLWTLSYQNYAQ